MKPPLKILARLAIDTTGSALVEMVIVVPLALAILAGAVDFGMAFATQATASKSVRDAARYLTTLPSSAVCGWGVTNAKNLVVYGNGSGSGSSLISGWSVSNVTITTSPASCASTPMTIIVNATVPYTPIIVGSLFPIRSAFTLTAQHEEPWLGQ